MQAWLDRRRMAQLRSHEPARCRHPPPRLHSRPGCPLHLQNHLLAVTQVDRRQFGDTAAATPPICGLVALEAFAKVVFTKCAQDVVALLCHQHARVFRIREINL